MEKYRYGGEVSLVVVIAWNKGGRRAKENPREERGIALAKCLNST